ncbi:hypothetical protein DFH28DRAFT_902783, partial [Melampsora americana]
FTESIPNGIPNEVRNLDFPNLRVIRGFFWLFDETEPIIELEWLQWPIFKNVRTLIMDFRWAKDHWRIALEQVGEGTLGKPANLKHFIFTTGILDYTPEYEPLIKAFNSQGIQCHFMPDPSYDQFLEWDLKVNGPIQSVNSLMRTFNSSFIIFKKTLDENFHLENRRFLHHPHHHHF